MAKVVLELLDLLRWGIMETLRIEVMTKMTSRKGGCMCVCSQRWMYAPKKLKMDVCGLELLLQTQETIYKTIHYTCNTACWSTVCSCSLQYLWRGLLVVSTLTQPVVWLPYWCTPVMQGRSVMLISRMLGMGCEWRDEAADVDCDNGRRNTGQITTR